MKKEKRTKLLVGLALVPILALVALFLLSGENLDIIVEAFSKDVSTDELREHLSALGIRGQATISILSMMQVIIVFLPAEPVQVLGGLTFGFAVGFLCCLIGIVAGNTIIFMLYKIFGERLREYFDKKINVDVESAKRARIIALVIFILYFLPAIPYGMIAFLATTSGMKFHRYIAITTLGVIPSVCIGVGLGYMALETNLWITVAIFVLLLLILVFVMVKRDFLISKVNKMIENKKKKIKNSSNVKRYHPTKLIIPYIVFRIAILGKVKFRITGAVKKIERPSIVLCNHGAFIDFAYAGTILAKESPNFVVARMYFFQRNFGKLLRSFGCFPKSIFALDTESAMNCVRVLKRGGVLAMMPEARLSTIGRFEDIQKSTYDFLKKMGVPVYVIKINGDYLAKPKWGEGLRRGALVEACMSQLFSAEELENLSLDEIKDRTDSALYYDELEWLKSHPELHYRSKKLAEGIENILTRCPKCGARYSMKTRGKRLWCESCEMSTEINSRYGFLNSSPFADFAEWYDWQFDEMRSEILADPSFALTSSVELFHASKDGKKQMESVGEGICSLTREGLRYVGTECGESVERLFPIESVYRVLFGAGVDFEVYYGRELYFFVPEEKRSCVDWYLASIVLWEIAEK